jgi:hypothetical protein
VSAAPYVRRQARRTTVALAADAATFALFAVAVGMGGVHVERNPVIAAAFAVAGVNGVIALKAAAALVLEWRARRFPDTPVRRSWLVPYAITSSLAIAGTVVGAGFNTAALVASLR